MCVKPLAWSMNITNGVFLLAIVAIPVNHAH